MWKYRGEIIFGLALVFALKAVIHPDIAAVCGMFLGFGLHYVDRFFSGERAEAKVINRMKAVEEELKLVKQEQGRLNMVGGIRGYK